MDPIVGLQFRQEFGKRWHLVLQGDIGGFEVGSKIVWNLFPIVGVDLHECIRLGFGYRAQGFNYASGEGLQRIEYDMIVSGPVIGVSFRF